MWHGHHTIRRRCVARARGEFGPNATEGIVTRKRGITREWSTRLDHIREESARDDRVVSAHTSRRCRISLRQQEQEQDGQFHWPNVPSLLWLLLY